MSMDGCCEWLNRVVTVNKTSRVITIQRLAQTHVTNRSYDLQLFSEAQTLSPAFKAALTCRTVLDCSTGWRCPHLLVAHAPLQGLITHELLVCNSKGFFEACELKFAVKKREVPLDGGYHLLDGPTMVWQQGLCVHIVCGEKLEHEVVDILTLVPSNHEVEKIRNLWCVPDRDQDGRPSILLMLQLQLKEADYPREFGDLDWMCVRAQLHKDAVWESSGVKAVRVASVIPSDYGCIATCVIALRHLAFGGSSGVTVEGVVYAVGTQYQQVVLFEGGRVRHVIPLQDIPQHVVAVKVRCLPWCSR